MAWRLLNYVETCCYYIKYISSVWKYLKSFFVEINTRGWKYKIKERKMKTCRSLCHTAKKCFVVLLSYLIWSKDAGINHEIIKLIYTTFTKVFPALYNTPCVCYTDRSLNVYEKITRSTYIKCARKMQTLLVRNLVVNTTNVNVLKI
jgi:hypothetical protein